MFFKRQEISEYIIAIIQKKGLIRRYFLLIIGCFLYALAFNTFFLPEEIVNGGVSGIAIITKNVFNLTPSVVILGLSLILLFVSYFTLGWDKTKGSIIGSILFPLMVELTSDLPRILQINIENTLLCAVFGGIIAGIGSGTIFKTGFTTGGTDIINQIISKYAKVSIGKSMLMSDGLIVLSAGFFLGSPGVIFAWEKVMYAVIVLYLLSFMADQVILGISQSKCFYIVTTHETAVKKYIMNSLNHGVTVLDGRGGFTGDHRKVIMCIVPTKEYFLLKEGINSIDPEAFFLVTDAYEVYGGE